MWAPPCSSPNRTKSEINSSYTCVIKLVSLTISLPSLPGARGSTEVVQFGLGCRRGVEGASSRAARGHVATMEETTRRCAAAPLSPVSPLPLCPSHVRTAARRTPKPPPAHRVRARSALPERAQSTPRPSPTSSKRGSPPRSPLCSPAPRHRSRTTPPPMASPSSL